MLGRENMIRIMEALDTNLNRTKQTELALETTSAMLDDEKMELWISLVFPVCTSVFKACRMTYAG